MDCEYSNAKPAGAAAYLLPVLKRIVTRCGPNAAVLDLGCGNGALTSMLAEPGWNVTGVDSSPSGIQIAQAAHAWPHVRFVLADAAGPLEGLAPESFDAVLSIEVIEHVHEPRRLVRNAQRLLRPGGLAVFTTPYHGYLKNLVLAAGGRFESHFPALADGGHIRFWSRKTLSRLLAEAGFVGFRFYGAGRLPYLWKSMLISAEKRL
jgi:2-polyprenyl-3-methyl-5-hydroxy-6-metoxy-1,4-benzoquinol methylase